MLEQIQMIKVLQEEAKRNHKLCAWMDAAGWMEREGISDQVVREFRRWFMALDREEKQ